MLHAPPDAREGSFHAVRTYALHYKDFFSQALRDGRIKHAGFSFHDGKDTFLRAYRFRAEQGRDASRCVQCGACESACPQLLSIIQWLRQIDGEYKAAK